MGIKVRLAYDYYFYVLHRDATFMYSRLGWKIPAALDRPHAALRQL